MCLNEGGFFYFSLRFVFMLCCSSHCCSSSIVLVAVRRVVYVLLFFFLVVGVVFSFSFHFLLTSLNAYKYTSCSCVVWQHTTLWHIPSFFMLNSVVAFTFDEMLVAWLIRRVRAERGSLHPYTVEAYSKAENEWLSSLRITGFAVDDIVIVIMLVVIVIPIVDRWRDWGK